MPKLPPLTWKQIAVAIIVTIGLAPLVLIHAVADWAVAVAGLARPREGKRQPWC